VLGPAGYFFSRRFVAPISASAKAAEQLRRDPRANLIAHGAPAAGAAQCSPPGRTTRDEGAGGGLTVARPLSGGADSR